MSEMPTDKAEKWLRDRAMKCEGATEHFPWGHTAIKVKGKMFLILSGEKGRNFSVTAKLPVSGTRMLDLSYCQPTGYGMGKHGWVSATWELGERVPMEVIEPWIEESYRAVAEGAKKKSGAKKTGAKKSGGKVAAGAKVKGAVKRNGAKSQGSSAATKRVKAKGAGEKSNATHARAPQRGPRTPRGRKTGRAARGV